MDWIATNPLSRAGKASVALFFVALAAFGGLVEYRSALSVRRMGDLDVFLRAAWAVRNDADLYAITSDNDWHYIYPPLYAILMTPLADPPPGAESAGYVRYPIAVALCYLLNLLCLLAGAHVLASVLEERADDAGFRTQPRFCWRWWTLRTWPILICLLPIGHTLMRGQVNVIVLASLCAAMAGWLRGQSFRAGLWPALAICIKVIPAYLLVYPVWRRDGRSLAGCLAGCFLGLVVIPGLAFGPAKALAHYETYATVFFGPLLNINDHDSLKEEILGANATDSIGVKNALHNWIYPDPSHRPDDLDLLAKCAYLFLGFVMTFMTLWPRADSARHAAYTLSGLLVLMTIFSPVCHSHYLLFCMPIVMCLLAGNWHGQATLRLPWWLLALFGMFFVAEALSQWPGLEFLKDRCITLFATVPFWAISTARVWRALDPCTRIQTTFDGAPAIPARLMFVLFPLALFPLSTILTLGERQEVNYQARRFGVPHLRAFNDDRLGGRTMTRAPDFGMTTRTAEQEETATRLLPPYNVILENDDHHSMPFVIEVLQKALGYNEQRSFQLMLLAHETGQAIVWTGSKEVAELKLEQMLSFHEVQPGGRKLGPLSVRIEPAPG